MSNAHDVALVRRALQGDRTARREVAAQLLGSIQREVAFCLIRAAAPTGRDPRQDVRDLVQEVIVALFERDAQELRRWDPERGRSLDSFVRLVARRRVARILGQRQGNPWSETPIAPEDLEETDDRHLTARHEDRHQLDRLLVALSARMSERDHELFDLLFVQEVEPDEVAVRLDMTRGAVNAWSYRMRKLARALAIQLDDASSSSPRWPIKEKTSHGG